MTAPATARPRPTRWIAPLSETYEYDDLARLIAYSVNGTQQKTWSLDSLGNNLSAGTYRRRQ